MDARLAWMFFGGAVGFVLGYIVRSLREIKQRVDEVDEHISKKLAKDDGLVRHPLLLDAVLFLVVAMTFYAAIKSQKNSNQVEDAQHKQDKTTECTKSFLLQTIGALNARTEFAKEQGTANLTLQKAQLQYLSVFLRQPPPNDAEGRAAFTDYYKSLKEYITVTEKANIAVARNPYPTETDYQICINKK